uniref:Major facilitator superfamily (MFS) profile domain-containing protein n=1 Tax=Alexandrium catenella TaxID=2925 RepID=A0A7S1PR09_ALECA|mmetsp:Transcript_10792/g.29329  ORF Transcript_10792/g.29329 Transcript_10792/m.29329 type:complete len:487 (+) Transcript_10792:92-1552(+)|eukprot:CAMPEP_0171177418 /NCGR_PEP_ID=MMETSP0790-20130122/12229_1 /TAXON_ID=2925 /ORGANISM="Alexandrium catenella, Strain OF101" /LENGTH=486 /DNA_ID=CAMNT_0011642315 /DNA_START=81 /DNA_END=1541 /DNA_ORIENTATION=+
MAQPKVAGDTRPSVAELIEDIGVGKAQLIILCTGGVVLFNRGIQMCLMSILTIPVASTFKLGPNSQGLLSTLLFVGMVLGTIASGYLGDRLGRRFPVCTSAILVSLFAALSALANSYLSLLILRFVLGFFMAFGDVPVTALLSEVTPKRWRIPMRAASEGFFDVGYTYAAFLATLMDPYLHDLQWRKLLLMASIPPGVLGILTIFILPESPVYLAMTGDHVMAQRILTSLKRMNGVPGISVDYKPPMVESASIPAMEQLRIIFGNRYRRSTMILAYTTFVINFFYYGGMYTQPQVMQKGHGLMPGWEIVLGGPADIFGILFATVVAQLLPRRVVLSFAMFMAAVGISCFGYAGSVESRSWLLECVYHFGVLGFYWVPAMTFIVLGQLSVETFPTVASATGGSVAFAMGRVGALAAPLVFENIRAQTGRWNIFCYIAAVGCLFGMLLVVFMWSPPVEDDDPFESAPERIRPLADAEEGKNRHVQKRM